MTNYIFIVAALLLSLFTAWQVMSPLLLSAGDAGIAPNEENPLLDQKTRVVQTLRDLDLDYSTGKVSDDEYQKMKASMSAELAIVLEKIDAQKLG